MVDPVDHSLTFELVNDKAELEEALEAMSGRDIGAAQPYLDTLLTLTARLMQSYESLLETSYALADAWESYMNDQTPAGLYVPS